MLIDRYQDLDTILNDYIEWYVENQTRAVDAPTCLQFLKLAIDGRLFILHHLRDQLMPLRDSRTNVSDLDTALDEFTTWYATNAEGVVDVIPLCQFLKKATDDSLHLLHLMRMELRQYQDKEAGNSILWLPMAFR